MRRRSARIWAPPLVAGYAVFLALWATRGLGMALIVGGITAASLLVVLLLADRRNYAVLDRLQSKMPGESIEHLGIASLVMGNGEMRGALGVSEWRLLFEVGATGALIELPLSAIKKAVYDGDLLLLTHEDIPYRFRAKDGAALCDLINASL